MTNKFILEALATEAGGGYEKHMANAQIYLMNPVGIGEHGDVLETIAAELDKAAEFKDRLDMIERLKERELNGR